jgi:hypothetical protein
MKTERIAFDPDEVLDRAMRVYTHGITSINGVETASRQTSEVDLEKMLVILRNVNGVRMVYRIRPDGSLRRDNKKLWAMQDAEG